MRDPERLRLILAQARIAKAALSELTDKANTTERLQMEQASLAMDAIELLADPDFHAIQAAE